jgi:hypothetical protein
MITQEQKAALFRTACEAARKAFAEQTTESYTAWREADAAYREAYGELPARARPERQRETPARERAAR